MRDVVVLGAGLHRFGRFPDKSLQDLGREAIKNALDDSGVPFKDIEVAYVGRVLAALDRGRYVRDEPGYVRLFDGSPFTLEVVRVRHDLLPIPYSHLVIEARRR